jgi:hypothetical protein
LGFVSDLVSFSFELVVENLALTLLPEEVNLLRTKKIALALGSHLEWFIRAAGCEETWRE